MTSSGRQARAASTPTTRELVGDEVASPTRQALANVMAALETNGASRDDVVRVGAYVTTPDDLASMNEVYTEFWGADPPPRTTVVVGLVGRMKIEIDAMAVVST